MNPLIRWFKFNLVGAMGMAVQLAALAGLNRLLAGHYLLVSAAAIELTLLHNFIWHLQYTWRDRRDNSSHLRQFVRFHLSNGLVSMLGNLALMRLFVHHTHLPLLVSNAIAILCCSVANFCLGNRWAFAEVSGEGQLSGSGSLPALFRCSVLPAVLLILNAGAAAHAQTKPGTAAPVLSESKYGTDCAYENVFAGPAAATGNVSTETTITAGVTFGQYFARTLGKGLTGSPQFELGVIGPLPHGHPVDGLASVDYMFANKVPHRNLYPFLTGGYTRMFVTGNAINFGLGLDVSRRNSNTLLRVELRDYWLVTGPQQHVIGLRIGVGKLIAD